MPSKKLKILFVSSEADPFAKSGGLGDVAGSLPRALTAEGVDCRLVIPKYACIPQKYMSNAKYVSAVPVKMSWRNTGASIFKIKTDVTTYLVENHYYFERDGLYGFFDDGERFAFFCRAVLEMLPHINFKPDIIHCNDWQTGPICILLQDFYKKASFYRNMKCIFTVHNLQYQGSFSKETLNLLDLPDYYNSLDGMEFHGNISYMKAGLISADAISTVSKTYANEIQTPQYGFGMDGVLRKRHADLCGIINGIDYTGFNPAEDKRIYSNYKDYDGKQLNKKGLQQQLKLESSDAPIIAMISRLVDQKGLDIISICMEEMISKNAQLVFLGTGEGRYEHMLKYFEQKYPKRVSANLRFDAELAQRIYAGADFFLMPSLFEPCGLGQLIAMRYGTAPIVRNTGGLSDTVTHFSALLGNGTGFVFDDYVADGMMWAVNQALKVYKDKESMRKLVKNAMMQDFSWNKSAGDYVKLYDNIKKGSAVVFGAE